MSAFLSPEWFEAAAAAAVAVGQADATAAGVDALIQYTVKGGPDGTVRCHVTVGDGRVTALAEGRAPAAPDIEITIDYDTAHDIVAGAHSAEVAYMNGDMRLEGSHAVWLTDLHELRASVLAALAETVA